jgi:histidine triad (HIT) family protein
MSEKTIFSRIIDREIPAEIEHEDDLCIAIHDINPQAPVHILVIPKKVITRVAAATNEDTATLGHLIQIARKVATNLKLNRGFRLVINTGPDSGETVPHLHVHLLAGRQMNWPPG